jgi:hypothetical protein
LELNFFVFAQFAWECVEIAAASVDLPFNDASRTPNAPVELTRVERATSKVAHKIR